jgi:hypothetical protein
MLSPKQLAATNFLDAHHSPTEYLIVVFLNIMHFFFKKKITDYIDFCDKMSFIY